MNGRHIWAAPGEACLAGSNVLTAEALNVPGISMRTDSRTVSRGHTYYWNGRARIAELGKSHASVLVQGSRTIPYSVEARMESGRITLTCDCPFSTDHPGSACKHQIAALLALQQDL